MICLMTLTHRQRQAALMAQVAGAEGDRWKVSAAGFLEVHMRRRKRNTLPRLLGLQYAAEQQRIAVDEGGRITLHRQPELILERPRFQRDR